MIRLLDDGEALIRQRAVELVRMLSEYALVVEGVQERVLHLLHAERDSGVRASLASTCGHLRARWALAELLSMLGDDDEQVARAALQALEQIATPDDSAIEAALLELVHSKGTAQERDSMLVQEARRCLRKLRRGKRGGGEQEALQSSS